MLATNMPFSSVDASLAQIDARTREKDGNSQPEIVMGPFRVLNLAESPEAPQTSIREPWSTAAAENDTNLEDIMDMQATSSTFSTLFNFDDSGQLQWADLFELDLDNVLSTSEMTGGSGPRMDFFDTYDGLKAGQALSEMNLGLNELPCGASSEERGLLPRISQPRPLNQEVSLRLDPDMLPDAHYLLKHFQDQLAAHMAPIPRKGRFLWEKLNLPAAVQTLAEMTYLDRNDIKHANAANLFSLFSCAAYHLATNPPVPPSRPRRYWEDFVSMYSTRAKSSLEKSFKTEFSGPGKAKYKAQLMAVLSTLTYSIISQNQKEARCYMIDAERLLRLRGLAKWEISKKARLLHHIYTWIRIVGESTYVIQDYETNCPVVLDQIVSPRHLGSRRQDPDQEMPGRGQRDPQLSPHSRLDDFLRLEEHNSDSDLELDESKDYETGLHDIHLEDSRHFANTMYLQMYGIPETWLSLVSQTTRLANIMDMARHGSIEGKDGALQEYLNNRAARLEHTICSFAGYPIPSTQSATWVIDDSRADSDDVSGASSSGTRSPGSQILQALVSALVILFYRRIRKVNSLILQGHVDDVITALRDFDDALAHSSLEGPGTPWPAFVAGCEAITPPRRQALKDWFERAQAKCGLPVFTRAKNLMMEVWEKRDGCCVTTSDRSRRKSGGVRGTGILRGRSSTGRAHRSSSHHEPWTWIEACREQKLWVMLC